VTRQPVWLSSRLMIACLWAASAAWGATAEEQVDRQTRAALSMDAHPDRGAKAFAHHCSGCHGARAGGDAARNIPMLAGQRYAYLIRQLANFAGGERDSSTMHGVVAQAQLRQPQAWVDIASYLNAIAVIGAADTGSGGGTGLGHGIFHEQCASCHGADAGGDADGFVPSLRHQHFGYLKIQMKKLAAGYRHNADPDLVLFLRSFDDRDIDATADYLSRLKGPAQDRKRMRDDGVVVD
jgi:cytochrome c553